jgi:uncharacterized small protein (DUF1192 family)
MTSVLETQKNEMNDIFKKLEQGIKDVFTSDNYKKYLSVMSTFHRYSYNNQILIMLQKPDASLIAGYNSWKQKKRQVKAGEQGIRILAPKIEMKDVKKDVPVLENGQVKLDPEGKVITESKVVKEKHIRYVPTSVFDISQTTGEPLPTLKKVAELDGSIPERDVIMNALKRAADIPVEIIPIESGAKGYYNFIEQKIAIKDGMSDLQTVKTAIHEVAHKLMHDPSALSDAESAELTRSKKEVQAESVAYVVSQRLGLDTSDYSFGYIAGWSSDKELTELKNSLKDIQAAAEKIINEVESELETHRSAQLVAAPTPIDNSTSITTPSSDIDLPTVTVHWSEHSAFPSNSTYSLAEFDSKMASLDEEVKQLKIEAEVIGEYHPYYKTKFQIDYKLDGETHSYVGRQDIGDGDGGVIDHIRGFAESELTYDMKMNHLTQTDRSQMEWIKDTFVPYLETSRRVELLQKEIKELETTKVKAEPSNPNTSVPRKSKSIASKAKSASEKAKTASEKTNTQNKKPRAHKKLKSQSR